MTTRRERALGALVGLAVGDALGMPTQGLPRERILATWGPITALLPAPDDSPIAAGLPAGSVTDDTEQALLLADLLLQDGGRIDPGRLAVRLADWEDRMRERGSLDLLGPSTRKAVQAVLEGVPPALAGTSGTTNGAAMRIAPVGIAVSGDDPVSLLDRVEEACLVSHSTSVAVAGAAAVAAAVSAAVDGQPLRVAIGLAIRAARAGARRGTWVAGADVGARIAWVLERAARLDVGRAVPEIVALIGTSLATQESVPAAFAMLALHPDDPWAACCEAAGLGGDTDTIAAMAGAIGGAVHGAGAFPDDVVATVLRVNGLDLERYADGLLALR
ncbi:MAG: ADP-ribosylglycohydrolase family protein [Amnibacterium sp.]